MAVNKRNPFATAHDFMGNIRSTFEWSRDTERPAAGRPLRVSFSVGHGRGNAKPEMTEDQFIGLVGWLVGGDTVSLSLAAVADAGDLSPVEIAARTLESDDDSVSFKVSNASGARTIKVPRGQWEAFTDFLTRAQGTLDAERDLIWPVVEPEAKGDDNPAPAGD